MIDLGITHAGGLTIAPAASRILAQVTREGECLIDWPQVEQTATDLNDDLHLCTIAKLLLAVRNGTWKSMKENA